MQYEDMTNGDKVTRLNRETRTIKRILWHSMFLNETTSKRITNKIGDLLAKINGEAVSMHINIASPPNLVMLWNVMICHKIGDHLGNISSRGKDLTGEVMSFSCFYQIKMCWITRVPDEKPAASSPYRRIDAGHWVIASFLAPNIRVRISFCADSSDIFQFVRWEFNKKTNDYWFDPNLSREVYRMWNLRRIPNQSWIRWCAINLVFNQTSFAKRVYVFVLRTNKTPSPYRFACIRTCSQFIRETWSKKRLRNVANKWKSARRHQNRHRRNELA